MIKLQNIEKSYNGERVLKGVSLEIRDGEFVSIMGESGSGKSTTSVDAACSSPVSQ